MGLLLLALLLLFDVNSALYRKESDVSALKVDAVVASADC